MADTKERENLSPKILVCERDVWVSAACSWPSEEALNTCIILRELFGTDHNICRPSREWPTLACIYTQHPLSLVVANTHFPHQSHKLLEITDLLYTETLSPRNPVDAITQHSAFWGLPFSLSKIHEGFSWCSLIFLKVLPAPDQYKWRYSQPSDWARGPHWKS